MGVHQERAQVLMDLGRPAQAEGELRRELAEQPNNSEAHRMLAWCLATQGRLPQAQVEAEEAIRLQPDYDVAHRTLGWILLEQRRWEEAERALREAIRLNPQDASHFFILATYFSRRKRWRDCEEAARQGLRIDAEHINCANKLAQALLELNRPAEAQEILKVVMARDPENEWGHITQGLVYQNRGKTEKALHHYQEAARINPENTSIHGAIKALKSPIAWGGIGFLIYIIIKIILAILSVHKL